MNSFIPVAKPEPERKFLFTLITLSTGTKWLWVLLEYLYFLLFKMLYFVNEWLLWSLSLLSLGSFPTALVFHLRKVVSLMQEYHHCKVCDLFTSFCYKGFRAGVFRGILS